MKQLGIFASSIFCLILSASAVADESYSINSLSGRVLGSVPIENSNLDKVSVAAGEELSLAVVEHGRYGGASLYLVAPGSSRKVLTTGTDQSLSQAVLSQDGKSFAVVRVLAPSRIEDGSRRLQRHGVLITGAIAKLAVNSSGAFQTHEIGNDVARVLGWNNGELIFTRYLPGDFPEERPFALNLSSNKVAPLLNEAHVHNLTLIGGQLYYARTSGEVLTAPSKDELVELVQQDLATGSKKIIAVEKGALPTEIRKDSRKLVWNLDTTLTERSLDTVTKSISTRELQPVRARSLELVTALTGNLSMPYIHQVYDTPDEFDGNWACGPTSTLMCIQHFGRLDKWPITVSVPSSHTSDYGAYVAYKYTAFGSTFDRVQNDAGGRAAQGAYGWCTDGGMAWAWRMQQYAQLHNLSSDFYDSSSFSAIQAALDAGKAVALSTRLTSAGHVVAVKGYTSDGRLVTNDPYGDKNQGYRNYNGEGATYTWSQIGAKWFITVYGDMTPVTPANNRPSGWIDGADCSKVWGWTQDPDEAQKSIAAHVYFNGPAGSGVGRALTASNNRDDLCGAIGSCNHAFEMASPYSLHDGTDHAVYAYGIDSQGGDNAELSGGPKTINCPGEPASGVKRLIGSADSFAAWKFDSFQDQMNISDDKLNAIELGKPFPNAPVMIRAENQPEVWLLDNEYRRHVGSTEIAASWRLDLGTVQVKTAAEVEAYPTASPIRARPMLVRGSGDSIFVIDDAFPAANNQGGSSGDSDPGQKDPNQSNSGQNNSGQNGSQGGVNDGSGQIGGNPMSISGRCGCSAGANDGPNLLAFLVGLASLARLRNRRGPGK